MDIALALALVLALARPRSTPSILSLNSSISLDGIISLSYIT